MENSYAKNVLDQLITICSCHKSNWATNKVHCFIVVWTNAYSSVTWFCTILGCNTHEHIILDCNLFMALSPFCLLMCYGYLLARVSLAFQQLLLYPTYFPSSNT